MRKRLFLLLSVFLFLPALVLAQEFVARGHVADTSLHTGMKNASVCVLNARDSILVAFTRSADKGNFELNNLSQGSYLLLITYPGYADYTQPFTLTAGSPQKDFGKIDLIQRALLLKEVVIHGTASMMTIKGDTTQFNARSFKLQPDASVEDLLKQLPGMQVDQNGHITAHGQSVEHVLVDGEEFFGDDPTLVTRNLRADMVDKVQLYDKKSDRATFTGIDDGKKEKTINLKLKEDKKNGIFGKANGGIGTDDYNQAQVMFNRFTHDEKFSFYGTFGNTGKTGLGWQDNQKYGAGTDVGITANGAGIIIAGGGDDQLDAWNGRYDGHGIPLTRSGGVHYDDKFDNGTQTLNLNYKIGSLDVKGNDNTLLQDNLPSGVINSNKENNFNRYIFRQKLDAAWSYHPDTATEWKIGISGAAKNKTTNENIMATTEDGAGSLLNDNSRSLNYNGDRHLFDAGVFYARKLRKPGRTLTISLTGSFKQDAESGYLNSLTHYYGPAKSIDSTEQIDQFKVASVKNTLVGTNIAYTEPLSRYWSLLLNYGLTFDQGSSLRSTYAPSAPGQYHLQIDSLSNQFILHELSNQAGLVLNYAHGPTVVNAGTDIANVHFNETINSNGQSLLRNFLNLMPRVSYHYTGSSQSFLSVEYSGSPTMPGIAQLQPVVVNDDPLNILLGNPGLDPSYTNKISVTYNTFSVARNQSLFLYGSYALTSDPIVASQLTDSTGRTFTRFINLKGHINSQVSLFAAASKKLSGTDLNLGLTGGLEGTDGYAVSNQSADLSKIYVFTGGLTLSRTVPKVYDVSFGFGPVYTLSNSSLEPALNDNGLGYNVNGAVTFFLPANLQFKSDANFDYRPPTEVFPADFHRTLVNATLQKSFFKKQNLKVSLSVNDLLNQNVGFNRNVDNNYILQDTYSTIRRYAMLSVAWDFSRFAQVKTNQ